MSTDVLEMLKAQVERPKKDTSIPAIEKTISYEDDCYLVSYLNTIKAKNVTMHCQAIAINGPVLLIGGQVVTTSFITMELDDGTTQIL